MRQKAEELKSKNGNIQDLFIFKVHNKYRLHLLKDFRDKYKIEKNDIILIVKEANVACPGCNRKLRIPGLHMFIVKDKDFTIISKKFEEQEMPVKFVVTE